MTTRGRVRVGLIGAGMIGRTHAENLAARIPGAELVAVADVDVSAAKALGTRLGVSKTTSDYADVLVDGSVDAVVIATPPFVKKEITLKAAGAGKHVFCEKPMALSLAEADEMVGAVEKSGICFQIGYQKRFDPSFAGARDAIARGDLGKVLLLRANNRDPPSRVGGWTADPKKSGSIFLDTCSHDFDAIRWLSGSEARRVYAHGSSTMFEQLVASGDYDTVTISIELASGALAVVDACTYTPYGFDSRAEVVGTKAAAFIGMGGKDLLRLYGKDTVTEKLHDYYGSRWGQAYLGEMASFVAAVSEGSRPKATVQDGRAAVEIGLAAWESARAGSPVRLPR